MISLIWIAAFLRLGKLKTIAYLLYNIWDIAYLNLHEMFPKNIRERSQN